MWDNLRCSHVINSYLIVVVLKCYAKKYYKDCGFP